MELWKSWSSRCSCKAVGEKRGAGGEWNQSTAKLWGALKCVCVREWVCVCEWVCSRPRGSQLLSLDYTEPTWVSLSHPSSCSPSPPPKRPSSPLSPSSKFSNSKISAWCHWTPNQCYWFGLHTLQSKAKVASTDIPWPVVLCSDSCSPVFFCWSNSRLRHKRSSVNSHIRQEDPF